MTVETPGASQPITTPPANVIEELRKNLARLDKMTVALGGQGFDEDEHKTGAVNHLRSAFPHVDDVTLAAILAYVAMGEMVCGMEAGCLDLMSMSLTTAYLAKELAWSVTTPDGQGHE